MSTLGNPLDAANFGPLEAIFQRKAQGDGPRVMEPIARAAIVRLTDSIYERYVKPVVANEQTRSFLERLPPQARAGFIGGALARAGYDSAGEIQANLPKHPGAFDFELEEMKDKAMEDITIDMDPAIATFFCLLGMDEQGIFATACQHYFARAFTVEPVVAPTPVTAPDVTALATAAAAAAAAAGGGLGANLKQLAIENAIQEDLARARARNSDDASQTKIAALTKPDPKTSEIVATTHAPHIDQLISELISAPDPQKVKLKQVNDMLTKTGALTAHHRAAQLTLHLGGANGSPQVEYVSATLRSALAKAMLDRFVSELEDDEVADMAAAGVDVPKSINQLLKLDSSFFQGENAPAHYFRGLNQDIIKGTTSCKAQPVLSVVDMKAALACWMDMLTMMQMDVDGAGPHEPDGCLILLKRKVGALRSDHGVSSRAVVIADYVLPVFQLFMSCFTEHPDAYYNKSFTNTRAPRLWNIIRYSDVTLMPEDLLPCEKTAARGAIQCFNRTKAKGASPDTCFADHKRATEKLSTSTVLLSEFLT